MTIPCHHCHCPVANVGPWYAALRVRWRCAVCAEAMRGPYVPPSAATGPIRVRRPRDEAAGIETRHI